MAKQVMTEPGCEDVRSAEPCDRPQARPSVEDARRELHEVLRHWRHPNPTVRQQAREQRAVAPLSVEQAKENLCEVKSRIGDRLAPLKLASRNPWVAIGVAAAAGLLLGTMPRLRRGLFGIVASLLKF